MLVRLVSQTFELAPSLYKFVVGKCKGGHWEHPDCNGTSFARDRLVDPVARPYKVRNANARNPMMFSFHGIDCSCLCDGNIILRRDKESIWGGCFGESILCFLLLFCFLFCSCCFCILLLKEEEEDQQDTAPRPYCHENLWAYNHYTEVHKHLGEALRPPPRTLSGLFKPSPSDV